MTFLEISKLCLFSAVLDVATARLLTEVPVTIRAKNIAELLRSLKDIAMRRSNPR